MITPDPKSRPLPSLPVSWTTCGLVLSNTCLAVSGPADELDPAELDDFVPDELPPPHAASSNTAAKPSAVAARERCPRRLERVAALTSCSFMCVLSLVRAELPK